MDRDFGAVLVVTFFDGDEDRLVGRLGGDVGVDRRRQRRRLQREDDALSKNFFKKNSSKNFLDHFSTSQVSRFLSRSIQSNIFLKKTKKSQLAAKEKTNSSFFQIRLKGLSGFRRKCQGRRAFHSTDIFPNGEEGS